MLRSLECRENLSSKKKEEQITDSKETPIFKRAGKKRNKPTLNKTKKEKIQREETQESTVVHGSQGKEVTGNKAKDRGQMSAVLKSVLDFRQQVTGNAWKRTSSEARVAAW